MYMEENEEPFPLPLDSRFGFKKVFRERIHIIAFYIGYASIMEQNFRSYT